MNLKKHISFLLLIGIYALILVHNLTPHCHHETNPHETHQHHVSWWKLLLNHHPEGIHGDDEIVKFLRTSEDGAIQSLFLSDFDGDITALLPSELATEKFIPFYYSVEVSSAPSYLPTAVHPIITDCCRFFVGKAPPVTMNI